MNARIMKKQINVLIVTPEKSLSSRITKALTTFGPCDTAATGMDAMQAYKAALACNRPYCLVALSCLLPGMDCFMVLGSIRTMEDDAVHRLSRSTVCLLSADSDHLYRYELRYGPDQYTYCLADPLNLDALEIIAKISRTRCHL
jgi:DNA-binding response OmpR family regulator